MKVWILLFVVIGLAACSAPSPEEAGPQPANYKDLIAKNIANSFVGAGFLKDMEITDPQPARVEFIPGWRVCVRGNLMPRPYGYFFADGQLQSVTKDDPICAAYAYTPWTEMEGNVAQLRDFLAHPIWIYRTQHDALQQTDRLIAELLSKNMFKLKFPYEGGTHGIVQVATTKGVLAVSLKLDRGAIECKTKQCDISLRFDNDPIEAISFRHSDSDDKSFVDALDPAPLLERLKSSHALVVDVPIPSNGHKQFTFETAGLDMAKLAAPVAPATPAIVP